MGMKNSWPSASAAITTTPAMSWIDNGERFDGMELLPREKPLRQPHDLVPGVYRSVQLAGYYRSTMGCIDSPYWRINRCSHSYSRRSVSPRGGASGICAHARRSG